MTFHGYAARRARARLTPFGYEPEPLGRNEVEIAITHCGICHSDVHLVDGDWGDHFPVVPGHEIIGEVVAGDGRPVGTRVGVGWQRGSCGECEYCHAGEDELCAASKATCEDHFGGFADRIRVDARFALPIPDALDSATAAPLLCGGVTVWSPLQRYAAPGVRVGVIGVGGLGHLALQFASAMGCEVLAFSTSADKEAAARAFGAHHFIAGKPPKGAVDLILNTAHVALDWDAYLRALRPKGVFCQLGAAPGMLTVPAFSLIGGRRTVSGSAIGSPDAIAEMLVFAGRHGVRATVEMAPMRDCDAALDKTRRSASRFRMVLTN